MFGRNIFLRLILFLIFNFIIDGFCQCVLRFPESRRNMPRYSQKFGRNILDIPYGEDVLLEEKEIVTGFCASYFENFLVAEPLLPTEKEVKSYNITKQKMVSLFCANKTMHYIGGQEIYSEVLKCKHLKWHLLESNEPHPWCDLASDSYTFLSFSLTPIPVLATACYDSNQMILRNLNFQIGPQYFLEDHNDQLLLSLPDFNKLNTNLTFVSDFGSIFQYVSKTHNKILYSLNHFSNKNNLLKVAKYHSRSIVQNNINKEYFHHYMPLIRILWWNNLRHGNWRRFNEVLEERALQYTYDIWIGTSDKLRIPRENVLNCTKSEVFEAKISGKNKTVPAYVWMYVQSSDQNKEFVFVGYNSPFYDFYAEDGVIFCKDICSEISWLDKIRSTFRFSILGVVFCCSAKEVRETNFLEGFPYNFMKNREMENLIDDEYPNYYDELPLN